MSGMKCIYVKTLLFMLLCFSCVDSSESDRFMDNAEAIYVANPDSAQFLLDEAEFLISEDGDFARWCMLSGKIEDERRKNKNPKPLLPVSRWLRAKEYYDKHGNSEDKAYIRLYLGRSLYDDGKYDEATNLYKEGLDLAQKAHAYSLSGYLSSYLGDIYLVKMMATEAMEKYKDAADFHQKGGNKRSWALALKELSISYAYNELYDDALFVLNKADSIIKMTDDEFAKSIIVNSFGILYEEMLDYEAAENFYLKSLEVHSLDQSTVYSNLSFVSIKKGDIYKARQYLNEAIPYLAKDIVLYQNYKIQRLDNNIDSSLFYLELYNECLDSIHEDIKKINVHEIEKKYDKSQIINEKNHIQLHLQRLIIFGLVFFMVIFIVFLIYNKFKNDQLRLREKAVKELDIEYRYLSAQLKEKERLLGEKEKLSEDFLILKRKLELIRKTLFEGKIELIKQSPAGRKIVEVSSNGLTSKSKKLKEEEWNGLKLTIKKFFPELYALIIEATVHSSEGSSRLCLLSFFDLTTKDEAFLLSKNVDAVRQNRTRLRRLFGIEESQSIFSYLKKHS